MTDIRLEPAGLQLNLIRLDGECSVRLPLVHAPDLPAVKWRQQNLDKLAPERRAALVTRLAEVLGIAS